MLKRLFKKAQSLWLKSCWYLGGQKEHAASGLRISSLSTVAEDATIVFPGQVSIGKGSMIMPTAKLICAGMPPYLQASGFISIGENSIIREGAILQTYGGQIVVGINCAINPYCLIQGNGGIQIGDNSLIAGHVKIFSANHVFSDSKRLILEQGEVKLGVHIGSDVWIGAGATILDGVTIGDGAVIAAGAVVNRNIPSFTVVAGVPAQIIKKRS